ncbi:MAG TPA: hypothetical protein VM305_11825, partial [Candidatus Limnocylindrales bacterium]|nr:hypothetical protein [Candidatus Limnocylindrales bacterium]
GWHRPRRVGRGGRPRHRFIPACATPEELARWERTNWHPYLVGQRATRICDDCPIGWAAEQRLRGRCNGSPGQAR